MPKHRQLRTGMPQSHFARQRHGPERGRSAHVGDRESLMEEILHAQAEEAVRANLGRNDQCPCGSGKKYKKCCMGRHREILSRIDPEERSFLSRAQRDKGRCENLVKEGYELLGRREFRRACSFAHRWSARFPKDDRFKDILVTAFIHLGEPRDALEIAQQGHKEALEEKEHFLSTGRHSWEEPGQLGAGHAYAPEAWLERLWVAKKALAYQEGYPKEPDVRLVRLVAELQTADDPDRYPLSHQEGLQARREALAHVLDELKAAGSRALPYVMPLCPTYGWSGLLVPELLVHWGDSDSIHALVDLVMFRYPYLSESCLKGLESIGQRCLPFLEEAFRRDREMDPLKTGLLSVAGEIGSPEAMEWLVGMLEHPLPSVVNWTAGVLGRKRYGRALPQIKMARERAGPQPYIMWAIEELETLSSDPGWP